MRFNLEIKCDNAAFDETPASEIARILRDVAKRVEQQGEGAFDYGVIMDSNGNKCGLFGLKD